MQITFTDYNYLMELLSDIAVVVEDSTLLDEDKNVVFKVDTEQVQIMGSNRTVTHRIVLDKEKYSTDVKETTYIQTRCKDLINFLSTYKSLALTKVKDIKFELKGNKLCITVTEIDTEGKERHSNYNLESPIVKESLKSILNTEYNTELTGVDTKELKWFTDNFLAGINASADLYGSIIFTEDKCIVLNPSYTLIGKNNIKELNGIRVSKKCLTFISKVLLKNDTMELTKTDRYLVLKSQTSETFLIYSNKLPPYSIYLNMINTEHSMEVKKDYVKEVLKRVSLLKEDMTVDIDCNDKQILFYNTKFRQAVNMTSYKNIESYDNIRFRIMPDVFSKILLDTDDDTINVFYTQKDENDIIFLSDKEQSWYSIIRVKLL